VSLTASDSRPEYVGVLPIVITELKFRNVERHVFGADFMEASDDPALKMDQKPSILFVWIAPTTYW
jgi:hypothetical protein